MTRGSSRAHASAIDLLRRFDQHKKIFAVVFISIPQSP
jgi:hypothetical protein